MEVNINTPTSAIEPAREGVPAAWLICLKGPVVMLYDRETVESVVYAHKETPYAASLVWNSTVEFEPGEKVPLTVTSTFPILSTAKTSVKSPDSM